VCAKKKLSAEEKGDRGKKKQSLSLMDRLRKNFDAIDCRKRSALPWGTGEIRRLGGGVWGRTSSNRTSTTFAGRKENITLRGTTEEGNVHRIQKQVATNQKVQEAPVLEEKTCTRKKTNEKTT